MTAWQQLPFIHIFFTQFEPSQGFNSWTYLLNIEGKCAITSATKALNGHLRSGLLSAHREKKKREREQRESSKSLSYGAIKLELGTPALHPTTQMQWMKKKKKKVKGWQRGNEREKKRRMRAEWEEVSGCVYVCVSGERESKRSDSLATAHIQEPLSHYKAQT